MINLQEEKLDTETTDADKTSFDAIPEKEVQMESTVDGNQSAKSKYEDESMSLLGAQKSSSELLFKSPPQTFEERHLLAQMKNMEIFAKTTQGISEASSFGNKSDVFISDEQQKIVEEQLKHKYNWTPQMPGKIVLRRDTVYIRNDGVEEVVERHFDLSYEEGEDYVDHNLKEKIKNQEQQLFELREKLLSKCARSPRCSGKGLLKTINRHSEYEKEYYEHTKSPRKYEFPRKFVATNQTKSVLLESSGEYSDGYSKKMESYFKPQDLPTLEAENKEEEDHDMQE